MNEYTFPEAEVLGEPQAVRTAYLPTSTGSFWHRRVHYFSKTSKQPLTAEQQQELIKLVREGDYVAKQKMLSHHMHLIVDSAKHYANHGLAPLDLIREGNRGLMLALEEFELEGDMSFLAFATWHICHHIECAIINWNDSSCRRAPGAPPAQQAASSLLHAVLPNKPLGNLGGGNGIAA